MGGIPRVIGIRSIGSVRHLKRMDSRRGGQLSEISCENRDALDQLGLKRYCCRRMVLTHVDLIEKLL